MSEPTERDQEIADTELHQGGWLGYSGSARLRDLVARVAAIARAEGEANGRREAMRLRPDGEEPTDDEVLEMARRVLRGLIPPVSRHYTDPGYAEECRRAMEYRAQSIALLIDKARAEGYAKGRREAISIVSRMLVLLREYIRDHAVPGSAALEAERDARRFVLALAEKQCAEVQIRDRTGSEVS